MEEQNLTDTERIKNLIMSIKGPFTVADIYSKETNRPLVLKTIDELCDSGALDYNYEDGINSFQVHKEKYTIEIPVPLGTTVYEYMTTCGDFCTFDDEKFDKIFPPKPEGRCSRQMPCHTVYKGVRELKLTLDNVGYILRLWNDSIFETKEEAENKGLEVIEEHRKKMVELGFELTEEGKVPQYIIDRKFGGDNNE